LKAAKDGTVVSGDSLGHVQFWDGNTGTLISSFEQNDNKADVLDLDITLDESKVFASGVDSRVVCIERSAVARDGTTRSSQWIMTHALRPHTHDVKAVVLVPNSKRDGTVSEVLCTGGLDTKLCTYSVEDFARRRPRTLYPWPGLKSLISIAKTARIIAMMREDSVYIYKLAKKEDAQLRHEPALVQEDDILIGSMQVEGLANLMCSSVSDDGRLLAISDTFSLVLFHMEIEGDDSLVFSKVSVDMQGIGSIVAVRFLDNCSLILATADGRVVLVAISTDVSDSNSMKVDKSEWRGEVVQTIHLPDEYFEGKENQKLFPVHTIVKSDDGRWFATIQNSSSSKDGSVHIFGRVDGGDSFQFWWTIPHLGSSVTAATFLIMDDLVRIATACLDFSVYLFDVDQRRLSKWSEAAGFPVSKKLPLDIAHRNDYPVRLAVDSVSPSTLLLVSTH
jgi:U3 small nucleolar RNA-associated protein 4